MSASGTYGGRTAEQRRADRRARLIEAAACLWVEQGWTAVSMRAVCARSGLVDRYFYESFPHRDDLLVAVWAQTCDELTALVVEAAGAADPRPASWLRSVISAVVRWIERSPSRARIVLTDCAECEPLQHARATALHSMTDLIVSIGRPYLHDANDTAVRMTTMMAVGGFAELCTSWQDGLVDVDADTIVEHVTTVATALAAVHAEIPAPKLGRAGLMSS